MSALFAETHLPAPESAAPAAPFTVRVVGRALLRAAVEALLASVGGDGRLRVLTTAEGGAADVTLLIERDGCESYATDTAASGAASATRFVLMSSTRHSAAEMEAGFVVARRLGVSAFVGDEDSAAVLIQAVEKAAQGEWYCSPALFPLIMRCLCEGRGTSAAAPAEKAAPVAATSAAASQFATAPAGGPVIGPRRPGRPRKSEVAARAAMAVAAVAMPAPPAPVLVYASSAEKVEAPAEGAASLSPREREIAEQALCGMSNAEIAAALQVSVATVKFHLSNIFEKLGIVRRSQLGVALSPRRGRRPSAAPRPYLKAA